MQLNRRSLLKLPVLALPVGVARPCGYRAHHDHVMGTSLDLVVFTASPGDATAAEEAVLAEIARLSCILNTRDPRSEVSRLTDGARSCSPELSAVLAAYKLWNRRTGGAVSTYRISRICSALAGLSVAGIAHFAASVGFNIFMLLC
jgi:thiamine biosynthesis lipoprotein ApbE